MLIEAVDLPKISLKKGGGKRFKSNHPWVFSNELKEIPKIKSGSLVSLLDFDNSFLAIGYFNPATLISFRKLTSDESLKENFIEKRIKKAFLKRKEIIPQDEAFRVVFGESDGLPGLIIDKYGDTLSLQVLTAGMENLKDKILKFSKEIFAPKAIIVRNDSHSREIEGLKREKSLFEGDSSSIKTRFCGMDFEFDGLECQKTGLFLDQRENINALNNFDFKNKRVLDLFSYFGSWGIKALQLKAREVIFVDSSKYALSVAKNCAKKNGFVNFDCVEGDVFDLLKSFKGEKFDFVFSDPPSFAKSSKHIKEAFRAYTNLNSMCMKLLMKDGVFVASTCSYHISFEMFFDSLIESVKKSRRNLKLIFCGKQSLDHPALLTFPESLYLKTFFLKVDES